MGATTDVTTQVTDTSVSATATISATPQRIMDFLRDPRNHSQLDGSGMVRAASGDAGSRGTAHRGPLSEAGQIFVMDMLWTDGTTRYRVENTVSVLGTDRLEWLVADYGKEPQGWRWGWLLEETKSGTRATNYCDWSSVTDPEVLAAKGFPVVEVDQVAATVATLRERFA